VASKAAITYKLKTVCTTVIEACKVKLNAPYVEYGDTSVGIDY